MKQVFNPYLPSYEYIPDGEPRIFGDRLYIYGSHDRFNGTSYCQNDYVCWSAPIDELWNWRYEGVIYQKSQHPRKEQISNLFAPDVIQGSDHRYYLYYSMAHSSVISVAVCDTPAGHYEYYGDMKTKDGALVGANQGDYYQFDPSIFIDDDGEVYLYSGFCPGKEEDEQGRRYVGAHVCRLEKDMITVKKEPVVVISRYYDFPDGARYFEAPSMRKINGMYYLVYSARVTGLYYFISEYPDHGFVYGGKIHSSSDIGINGHSDEYPAYPAGNTHGGIVCIHNKYYIFDHRFTNGSSYCRQGVAEEIQFDENGRIKQVEATSCGLNHGPLSGNGEYPSYIACNLIKTKEMAELKKEEYPRITQDGEDRESGENQYVKGMCEGWILGYKYFTFQQLNTVLLSIRGTLEGEVILQTSENGAVIGTKHVKLATDQWSMLGIPVQAKDGVHAFYITYKGAGTFDLKSFELQSSDIL